MLSFRLSLVFSLILAGCGTSPAPLQRAEAPEAKAPQREEVASPPAAQRAPAPPPVSAAASAPAAPPEPKSTTKASPKPTAPPPVASTKPSGPGTTPPVPAAKAPVPPTTPPAATAPVAARPPPLDLKSLEQRLRDTSAIGVLTKLSLKNQVDDLLGRFRTFHQGQRPPTLGELRPAFELLLMKVLALVQDHDRSLANDINASREAIWGVLSDREKLSQTF